MTKTVEVFAGDNRKFFDTNFFCAVCNETFIRTAFSRNIKSNLQLATPF